MTLQSVLVVSVCALVACSPRPAAHPAAPPTEPLAVAQLIVAKNASAMVDLRVVFRSGSIDDPRGQEGLTYLTAHVMAEGAAGGLSYSERSEKLYPLAGSIDVQVAREQTTFVARVHKDRLADFYPMFRDVLLSPAFERADIGRVLERQRVALVEELRGNDDEALGKALLQSMLYVESRLAHPELGTEQALGSLRREDVVAQRARTFCRGRVDVGVAGPVNDDFVTRLRADLGALPSTACVQRVGASIVAAPKRRLWLVDKPEASSVAISLGMPIGVDRRHPDYAALVLAAAYLGQHRTFAGRLMQKLRGDRGLNYGDYAYAEHFEQAGWSRFPATGVARNAQYFSIWLRPVRPEHARFALRMAVRELLAFVRDGLSEADFVRIQQFASQYFTLFAQTEQQRLGYALDQRFYGLEGEYLATLCARMKTLTHQEVNAAIARYVDPSTLQVAIVAKGAAQLADDIASESPTPIAYDTPKSPELLAEDAEIAKHPVGIARDQMQIIAVDEVFAN